jgi:hypothetical protein
MSQQFGNFFNQKRPQTDGHAVHKPAGVNSHAQPVVRKPVFTKVFRWRLPDGETRQPSTVEVIGTFTKWQKVPLARTNAHDGWQVALNEIPSHRTHRYVILVDGKPVADAENDGYAIPLGPLERKYQLMTDRGPRVLMLFAQTK